MLRRNAGFATASGNEAILKYTDQFALHIKKKGEYFELRFIKPFKATDNAYLSTTKIDSATTLVKWGFDGKMPYPMNLSLLFMSMDKMLGSDLELGLQQLKNILEK